MMKFRKKPVVIEAFQMTKERRMDNSEWPAWLNEAWNKRDVDPGAVFPEGVSQYQRAKGRLIISTLEGDLAVNWGDWIIQGVKCELYPCRDDIFKATYEAVE